MAVKTEKELSEGNRATWLKALSAMQLKNYGYTIQLTQALLKQEPSFLTARQLVRKAAIAKNSGKKGLMSGMSTASFSLMKVQGMVKKDPLAAIDAIEKVLETEPYNQQANLLLRDAASAAALVETATFALETILEGNPKDVKMLHELAAHYTQIGEAEKAVDVYNRIIDINPADLVAVKGSKDASARASMQKGGWERQDATYRDLIKDKEAAVSMEQQSRVVRSDEMIDQQLAEYGKRYEETPESIDVGRKIAELYEQKGDLDNAITWYTYTAGLTNNSDAALVRKAKDLQIKQYDKSIAEYEAFIAANPDSEETKPYVEQLATIKRQRAEYSLDEARSRVERNPTDLNFRFELGELLVNTGNYKDAIQELQKARSNPSVRLRAISLLGKCFVERGMLDLAARTLEEAVAELTGMDPTKKEIVYNLGLIYEKMGDKDRYIAYMKQIYEIDYGYRDVADRVESSYTPS